MLLNTPRILLEKSKDSSYTNRNQSDDRSNTFEMHQQEKHEQYFAIDAVLVDFNMPRMNGPDTIVEMRKMGFRGPIFGVSGGEEETMQQFLQVGADDVLQKPAKTDKLVGMLLRGFEQVVRDESTTNGQANYSTMKKTRGNSEHSSLRATGRKSIERRDDGSTNPVIIAYETETESARQKHMSHLRQFVETTKSASKAKK